MLVLLLHPFTAVVLAILIAALVAGVIVLYVLMAPESPPSLGPGVHGSRREQPPAK
jgi:hypothetical protein